MDLEDPPTYDQATTCQPIQQAVESPIKPQTLTLDGCTIHSSSGNSTTIAYELSAAPCDAIAYTYDVYKLRYRLTRDDGEGDIVTSRDRIYSFEAKPAFSPRDPREHVLIHGHSSRRWLTHKEVVLEGGTMGWAACKAKGHFSAAVPFTQRLNRGKTQIVWKDNVGQVIAFETRSTERDAEDEGSEESLELRIDEFLDPRDFDLLVACWMARLWKESKARDYEQLPSSNFKNFTSLRFRQKNTARLGGSTIAASGTYF